jgi:D-3-phosphoglycerate dehydrogenase
MARILATDGMADEGVRILRDAGHTVDLKKLSPTELLSVIGEYDGLVVRSATQVTQEVLAAAAPRLKVVGRAGVGVDNIDVPAATAKGIIVMNAPLGNILSAAEHTIGMIFAAARAIPQAHAKLTKGEWDKKSFVGNELHGKVLGIVGLGKIGKHVAKVLQAAGMEILAYDPFLTKEVAAELRIGAVDLEGVLSRADFLTLHVPLTDQTANLLDARRLALMKKGARIVNVARGGIIDETALAESLKSGHLACAALDVFAVEPLGKDSPLYGLPNAILTPHLGASTEEAQTKVSVDIAHSFNAYFASGAIANAVNVKLTVDPAIDGYLAVAERMGAFVAQLCEAPVRSIEVRARGELASFDTRPLAVAALKGAISRISEEAVNFVNAELIAKNRGIELSSSSTQSLQAWSARLAIKAGTAQGEHIVGGSLVDGQLRVQRVDDYILDLPVGGHLLLIEYPDRPGMVGRFGSILGDNRINIARMEVSRIDGRGDALVILTLDDPVPATVLDQLREALKPRRLAFLSV